uniref:Major facilitator superfamily (MFS) profile domain-containing protein n=1 Tax=Bionectria ochroleuca TaxID=29856 RepID=A0A8H7NQB8_BIOOC
MTGTLVVQNPVLEDHAVATPDKRPADTDNDPSPPPDDNEPPATTLSPLQIATVMSCLCACVFVTALDITIVATAVPAITHDLSSGTGYTWIGAAFTLTHCAATPVWAKISDIWGRKSILLWANAIFFAGSLACALSKHINALIAARAIQGLGAGGMATIVNLRSVFAEETQLLLWTDVGRLGLGKWHWARSWGVFTSRIGWRWCFWINLPITGAVFPLLYFTLKLPNPKTPIRAGLKAIDWTGSFLILGGAVMLLLGLHLGGEVSPWGSPTIICLLIFSFVAGGLFIVNESKVARYPVIPMRLFRDRSAAASFAVTFLHSFAFMGVAWYLPLYFQAVLLSSPLMSGVYLLPFIVSSSVPPPIFCGLVCTTLGVGLMIDIGVEAHWGKLIAYQLVGGAGFGLNIEGPLLAVQTAVPAQDVAVATAAMSFTRTISTSISIVIGGVVFQNEMSRKKGGLESQLGPDVAELLGGGSAAANVEIVQSLPVEQQIIAQKAFYESIRSIWILYVAFSGAGLLLGFLIRGNHLNTDHEVTKVGLEELKGDQSTDQSRSNKDSSATTTLSARRTES